MIRGVRWTGCFNFCSRPLSGGGPSDSRPRAERKLSLAMVPANPSRFALPPATPNGASCSIPSCGLAKPTWTAVSWSSKARSPMYWPSCSARTAPAFQNGQNRNGTCDIFIAGCNNSTRAGAQNEMSRTITIWTGGSIRYSSTLTGNIAAPISSILGNCLTTHNSRRSATWRQSCSCSRPDVSSTLAAAGVASGSIWRI